MCSSRDTGITKPKGLNLVKNKRGNREKKTLIGVGIIIKYESGGKKPLELGGKFQ